MTGSGLVNIPRVMACLALALNSSASFIFCILTAPESVLTVVPDLDDLKRLVLVLVIFVLLAATDLEADLEAELVLDIVAA